MTKTIVVVARQAGTANAFVPLFERFRSANINAKTFAFTHAQTIFENNKIDATLIDRYDACVFSSIPKPSLLLTGTSEYVDEDVLFWQWAKNEGIPSWAFVDSWVSYWQRFTPSTRAQDRFSYTPDLIAVIDRFMYDRMVENGCDKKLLLKTGNPAFDGLRQYVPRDRESIVRKYGENYFLFIGEPFNNRVFGGSEKDTLGYTETEVLTLVSDALEKLEEHKVKLLFRPHPRGGCIGEIRSIIDNHNNIVADSGEFNSRDLIACAKVVLGMTSMLLFEASLMGVPAISIQPNKKQISDLIDCCCKIPVVTHSCTDEVRTQIEKILSTRPRPLYTATSILYDAIRLLVNKQ